MHENYTEVQHYLMMFGSAQKWVKHSILNRFLLIDTEMWIQMAIKSPHNLDR